MPVSRKKTVEPCRVPKVFRRMHWAEGFIAADWGTTNRRAYLIDATGKCVDEFEDDKGIMSVAEGGFEAAVAEVRERLGDRPLLLAGMVGSNRGWVEAPYVPCPAGLPELADKLVWPERRPHRDRSRRFLRRSRRGGRHARRGSPAAGRTCGRPGPRRRARLSSGHAQQMGAAGTAAGSPASRR